MPDSKKTKPALQSLFSSFTTALLLVLCAPACPGQPAQTNGSEMFCIDLSKFFNTQLTNTLECPLSVKENNLGAMPTGRQIFSGVPFVVEGVVQLSGRKLQEWGRNEFPEAINGIPVGRKFSRLYALHGAGGVFDPERVTIGKLAFHYADGSVWEIEIKTAVHVRDFWGDPKQELMGTTSELAWTGTNPALKEYEGDKPSALRIYKTRFQNPKPGLSVSSIDYRSAMRNSSPFLLALTVE
jgi:hypothetical protein